MMASVYDLPRPLSVLDNLITHRYTRYTLFFALQPTSSVEVIKHKLHTSLSKTISAIPFLSATVSPALITHEQPQKGALQISEPLYTIDQIFSFRDASSEPSLAFEALSSQDFPFSDKCEDIFSPSDLQDYILQKGLGLAPAPAPVMRVQMTLLDGGFALCLAIHHNVMDGTSMLELFRLWAETCCVGRTPVLDDACLDTSRLMEGEGEGRLEDHQPYGLLDQPKWLPASAKPEKKRDEERSTVVTEVVRFSEAALSELKKLSETMLENQEVEWVSTNDLLVALLWTATISSRASTLHAAKSSSCYIAVDARKRLYPPLPPTYMHNAVVNLGVSMPISELISSIRTLPQLVTVAARIRQMVQRVDSAFVHDIIAMARKQPDLERLSFAWGMGKTDCFAVSLMDRNTYELDWGEEIGFCRAFREPYAGLGEGTVAIYPKRRIRVGRATGEKEVEVLVTLQRAHFERFWEHDLIRRFAKMK